jgi:hypothetical protein
MPSYKLYKMLHFAGIVMVVMAIAGVSFHAWLGGAKADAGKPRKVLLAAHGAGMFLILLGGMGAGTAIGAISSEAGFASWIHPKLALWAVVAALPALPYRSPKLGAAMFFLLPVLVMLAAWIAGGFAPLTR